MKNAKVGDLIEALYPLSEDMVGDLLDLARRYGKENGPDWQRLVRNTLSSGLKPSIKNVANTLLVLVNTISITATHEKFVAKDVFVINTQADAKVKIAYLGNNFENQFLAKTEEPIQRRELIIHRLGRVSVDSPIIVELGGKAKTETTLTEMFSVMSLQGSGEEGILLTDGCVNIFYVRDVSEKLCSVIVTWMGNGWLISTSSTTGSCGWACGSQLFSRSSVTG